MSNRFMISVAALALIAGTDMANAQGTMNRDSGGGAGAQPMQHAQPSGGAAERSGGMGRDAATQDKSIDKGTVGQASGSGGMKSDRASDDKSSGAMNKNAADDKAGAAKSQRSDERAQGQMDRTQQDRSKSMSQDTTKSGTGTRDQKAEGRTSTTVGQAGAGAKLSTEQRTQITSVIRDERVAPVTNVNFSVSVGSRIPREGIELHALPSRVATIYPEWRSYRYVMVRDQIVIIDPNTYEIVAVLDV